MARQVAECYGRGFYVSKKIVTLEIKLLTNRYIKEGNRVVIPNLILGLMMKGYNWLYVNAFLLLGINFQLKSWPKL